MQPSVQVASANYDSAGNLISETSPIMSSKDYQKMKAVQAAESSNAAFYSAQQAKYSKLTDGRDVALVDAIAALSGNKNPTNYNDTLVAETNASVAKHQTWAGFGKSVINGGLVGYGIGKVAGVVKDGFSAAGDSVGGDKYTTTGDGNSSTNTAINQVADNESSIQDAASFSDSSDNSSRSVNEFAEDDEEEEDDLSCVDSNFDGFVDGFTGSLTVAECEAS